VRLLRNASRSSAGRPDRTREKSDWQVEVQVHCPLLCGIGLEYQGLALPALTPQVQDQITQDVHLACWFLCAYACASSCLRIG
jgi:hypothetical protein